MILTEDSPFPRPTFIFSPFFPPPSPLFPCSPSNPSCIVVRKCSLCIFGLRPVIYVVLTHNNHVSDAELRQLFQENYCPQSTNRRNEKQNKTIDERRAGEKSGRGKKGSQEEKAGKCYFFARGNRGRKILKENSYVERGSHTVTSSGGCPTSHLYSRRENSLLFGVCLLEINVRSIPGRTVW